ncbi:MAG: ribbon-helix-helix domain-containing protein [Kiloniellales bacterium]
MCRIFAGQDPSNYACITRSVRLAGHATSIRLEAAFWEIIDQIAEAQGMTTPRFLSTLYDEVLELHGQVPNFASLLRSASIQYLRSTDHVMAEARRELAATAAE